MGKLDQEQEKNAVDLITNSMFSLSFLESISNIIFGPNPDSITVKQFYKEWIRLTNAKDFKIPYNLGAILGYLYVGILFAKEHWQNLLPDIELAKADPKWGISGTECNFPNKKNPSLKDTVRRIRNALGHGRVVVNVPKGIKRSELMSRVTLHLHDVKPNKLYDTFDITLSLEQLCNFIKAFQSVIHKHVRSKSVRPVT